VEVAEALSVVVIAPHVLAAAVMPTIAVMQAIVIQVLGAPE